ncbi:hypothetical protein [Streptomyces sp. NPDC059455]
MNSDTHWSELRAERDRMTSAIEELELSRSLLDRVITAGQTAMG